MWLVKIVVEVEKICHSDFSVVSSTQVHSFYQAMNFNNILRFWIMYAKLIKKVNKIDLTLFIETLVGLEEISRA